MIRTAKYENIPTKNRNAHASSISQLPNGRVVVAWFEGREGSDSTQIRISYRKSDGSWETSTPLKVSPLAHWNPVLFWDPFQSVLTLWFKVGYSPKEWETWVTHSTDGGITWKEPKQFLDKGRGPVRCKPIVLSNGNVVTGGSIETTFEWTAFVDIWNGDSWKRRIVKPRTIYGKGIIQPTLWESKPGHVHMLCRSTCGLIVRADSENYGQEWNTPYPINFPNNNSGIDVVNLGDELALVCNPIYAQKIDPRMRGVLAIFQSEDNGFIWREHTLIESGEGEFSYPAMIVLNDGIARQNLGVTFTNKRDNISFSRVVW